VGVGVVLSGRATCFSFLSLILDQVLRIHPLVGGLVQRLYGLCSSDMKECVSARSGLPLVGFFLGVGRGEWSGQFDNRTFLLVKHMKRLGFAPPIGLPSTVCLLCV
jgi:hypothetical protein